ncbi:hypothetical protein CBM2637_B110317 [Cupriavidus taiwanensis]|nr:hypothetical protein CBM2637_B110317 [Cupriavidus taiwanensis]
MPVTFLGTRYIKLRMHAHLSLPHLLHTKQLLNACHEGKKMSL